MNLVENNSTCARHPKIETNLKCAACGAYICPKCMVQTPVGAKCPECASSKSTLFTLSPLHFVVAAVVSIVAGAIAGWIAEFIGFFAIFLAVIYGGFVGEVVMRSVGRKRGIKLEILTGAAMVFGVIAGRMIVAAIQMGAPGEAHPPFGVFSVIVDLFVPLPIPAIALAVAVASAVSRIRYL